MSDVINEWVINFWHEAQPQTPGTISLSRESDIPVSLEGSDEGSIYYAVSPDLRVSNVGSTNIPSGDAAWVPDENGLSRTGHGASEGVAVLVIEGVQRVRLREFCNAHSGRVTRISVNGGDPFDIPNGQDGSQSTLLGDFESVGGQIEVTLGTAPSSSGSAYWNALLVQELTSTDPQITATQPPQGGEVFQFSGSNYAAQPVGPMTFTQGTRVISRAVTISNWNAADGSFTGVTNTALPGVPAAGASDSPALLYGESVTISLPDPGA